MEPFQNKKMAGSPCPEFRILTPETHLVQHGATQVRYGNQGQGPYIHTHIKRHRRGLRKCPTAQQLTHALQQTEHQSMKGLNRFEMLDSKRIKTGAFGVLEWVAEGLGE